MALQNNVVIEGKLVRYELKVVKDFSIGTGSIARSFGKEKPMAFFDFEIWNPTSDLDEMLQNAASEEQKPFVRLTGALRQDVWQDKQGKTQRKIKITATEIEGITPDFTRNDSPAQEVKVAAPARPSAAKAVVNRPAVKNTFKPKPFSKPQVKAAGQDEENVPF